MNIRLWLCRHGIHRWITVTGWNWTDGNFEFKSCYWCGQNRGE